VTRHEIPCASRNVAFIVKSIDMIILFACLLGWLNSSPVEIQKQLRHDLLKLLELMLGLAIDMGLA